MLSSACGTGAVGGSEGLSRAVDERGAQLDEGEEASLADLLFGILAAGLQHEAAATGDQGRQLTDDPSDPADHRTVDAPLTPSAPQDRRGLVSGTSPDPAPEIDDTATASGCASGYAAFQGECLPQEVVDGLLALGLDPEAPPSEQG